jgi:hypothetical protein
MDVLRPLRYLAGLLNRMTIKAIAASSFIRAVKYFIRPGRPPELVMELIHYRSMPGLNTCP